MPSAVYTDLIPAIDAMSDCLQREIDALQCADGQALAEILPEKQRLSDRLEQLSVGFDPQHLTPSERSAFTRALSTFRDCLARNQNALAGVRAGARMVYDTVTQAAKSVSDVGTYQVDGKSPISQPGLNLFNRTA